MIIAQIIIRKNFNERQSIKRYRVVLEIILLITSQDFAQMREHIFLCLCNNVQVRTLEMKLIEA